MKLPLKFLLATIFITTTSFAQSKGKQVTITGEVVDVQCYVTGKMGPGRSQEHKECAINCAKGGIPLGILEDKTGNLYIAGQTKVAYGSATKMLLDYVADKVEVKGHVYARSGIRYLVINEVKRVAEK